MTIAEQPALRHYSDPVIKAYFDRVGRVYQYRESHYCVKCGAYDRQAIVRQQPPDIIRTRYEPSDGRIYLTCGRCGHEWTLRSRDQEPVPEGHWKTTLALRPHNVFDLALSGRVADHNEATCTECARWRERMVRAEAEFKTWIVDQLVDDSEPAS